MDRDLKKMGSVFNFIALCLGRLAKTQIMVYSMFENALDIFLLVFYEHFMSKKKVLIFNLGQFCPKNNKIPMTWSSIEGGHPFDQANMVYRAVTPANFS